MSTKKVTEYTDRELLEKATMLAKTTADNTTFIKNYLIVIIVLSIIGAIAIVAQI
jgi:hypothetical protein